MYRENDITAARPLASRMALAGALGGLLLFGVVESASAGLAGLWTRDSQVTDTVGDNGDGTWDYGYTVLNTSEYDPSSPDAESFQEPVIIDWELPWFDDAGITDILSPAGWNWAIETVGEANPLTGWDGEAAWQDPNDPWYILLGLTPDSPFATHTKVLHWYSECAVREPINELTDGGNSTQVVTICEDPLQDAIFAGGELGGFGFTAAYDQTAAPYQASWAVRIVRTGDPAFPLGGGVPASPQALGTAASVSEPATLMATGLGVVLASVLGLLRRRRADATRA